MSMAENKDLTTASRFTSLASKLFGGVCIAALLAFLVWFAMNYDEISEALLVTIILIGGMFALMAIGVSVAVSIGLPSAFALVLIMPDAQRGLYTSAQKIFDGIDNFNLLCIPLFVLAGVIMNQGGIAARLINLAKALAGQMPGALMHTNILANMMFGAISGSALAGASAVGSVMSPAEKKDGYDMNWAAAVNIASAPAGMLIPPSNITVVYAMVSQASVGALFLAGYIPGFLWGLTCMLIVWWYARQHKELRGPGFPRFTELMLIIWQALPSLMLVVIVMVGIVQGYFTPTEGSAIAVAYALILSFIYGTIKVKDLPNILTTATQTSSVVIFLIGLSTIMSFAMTFADIPELIANWMIEVTGGNKILFIMLMMVILLVIGIPLDATPAVLIFTPIFLPIAQAEPFFIHPVHFGMMMVFNMCIAVISPPSAPVLFVGARVAGKKVEEVMMPLMPFFIALIVTLVIIQFIPELSMWLPDKLGMVPDWANWPK
jgi:tripartite ATP-independent transporter DctM subunit